ncbi:MAG: response regulator [Treponema sp.]|nr:response regulator [Treponema sp.]
MAKILIVEDEPVLELELTEDLQGAGYEVVGVEDSGDKAMFQTIKKRPDLIVMDIKLHGFRDGIDSALQIRGFYPTPIIYLTSYALKDVEDRIRRTSPAWYLQKPYSLPTLLRTIEGILSGSLPPQF